MIHSEKFTVKWHDTGADLLLRPTPTLVFLQETANLQLEKNGMGLDAMRYGDGLAFILSRLSLQFLKPIHAYENITAQTWTCEAKGVSFPRCYRILNENNEVAVEAGSVWALINLNNRTFVKGTEFEYPVTPEAPLEELVSKRIRLPKEGWQTIGNRMVFKTECDYNGHMNNTRYPDMLLDFLPNAFDSYICDMTLAFKHEATLGHTLQIDRLMDEEQQIIYFRTYDSDTLCLEAEIHYIKRG